MDIVHEIEGVLVAYRNESGHERPKRLRLGRTQLQAFDSKYAFDPDDESLHEHSNRTRRLLQQCPPKSGYLVRLCLYRGLQITHVDPKLTILKDTVT
jgi:hypothetical protein